LSDKNKLLTTDSSLHFVTLRMTTILNMMKGAEGLLCGGAAKQPLSLI